MLPVLLEKGEARFYDNKNEFKLYEVYGRYNDSFGNVNLTVTGGYSFQQNNYTDKFFSLGISLPTTLISSMRLKFLKTCKTKVLLKPIPTLPPMKELLPCLDGPT